jgi:phosphomannomutase
MRSENAIYGGEMSAHHYFRDFSYCDSGMIPWLLVLELLSQAGRSLSELMRERMEQYPCSGEINSKVKDADEVLAQIESEYGSQGQIVKVDGLSIDFDSWRFNLRKSNTEPVIRLNVESRHDDSLMKQKTKELLEKIRM